VGDERPGEFVFPQRRDPAIGGGVVVGVERVQQVSEAVGAGLVLGGGHEAREAAGVVAVEGVTLGGDDVGVRVEFVFGDAARHDSLVVGVERREPLPDAVDLVGGQGADCRLSGGLMRAALAGDGAAGFGGDDGHAVGVGERPAAAEVGDGTFEQGE
jgi:hypothetical protein